MGRRGHSTTIGKFAKIHHDRRVSEIRVLGEALRAERRLAGTDRTGIRRDGGGTSGSQAKVQAYA